MRGGLVESSPDVPPLYINQKALYIRSAYKCKFGVLQLIHGCSVNRMICDHRLHARPASVSLRFFRKQMQEVFELTYN